jgi:hypothetical protein
MPLQVVFPYIMLNVDQCDPAALSPARITVPQSSPVLVTSDEAVADRVPIEANGRSARRDPDPRWRRPMLPPRQDELAELPVILV